jgi:hypothetical protein
MKKKLLIMFFAALSAMVPVSCNAVDVFDLARGVNLADHFGDDGNEIFTDPAKKFVEIRTYEVIYAIASVIASNGRLGAYTNADKFMICEVFIGSGAILQPQDWLNNSRGTYTNVKTIIELLDLGLDANLANLSFCKAKIGTAALPDYSLIFKSDAAGGIGLDAAPRANSNTGFKKRILKILFESTLDSSSGGWVPNVGLYNGVNLAIVRASMAAGTGVLGEFTKDGGIVDKANDALCKVRTLFKAVKDCFENFFALANCLGDICNKLGAAKQEYEGKSMSIVENIDKFESACKKLVGCGDVSIVRYFDDANKKSEVSFRKVMGCDSNGRVLKLYRDISVAAKNLAISIGKYGDKGKCTDKTVKVLNGIYTEISDMIDTAKYRSPNAFAGINKMHKIVCMDRFYMKDDSKNTFCSMFAELAKKCEGDELKLGEKVFGKPKLEISDTISLDLNQNPEPKPEPKPSVPAAPAPTTTFVTAPASVSYSSNATSKGGNVRGRRSRRTRRNRRRARRSRRSRRSRRNRRRRIVRRRRARR